MLRIKLHKKINELKQTNKVLVIKADSLQSELFVETIKGQRLDEVVERAEEEMSPNCYKELENILNETE